MATLPTGTITFLFSDLVSSTARWESAPEAMDESLRRHDALATEVITSHGGAVFKTVGDGVYAAFADPLAAVEAALAFRDAMDAEPWPEAVAPLAARVAVHTGTAVLRDDDYFGPTLNRVARLIAVGHGGQILLSAATRELIRGREPGGLTLVDFGAHRLRDLLEPQHIYGDGPVDAPPLRTLDARTDRLPVQLTAFLGRSKEVADVISLIGAHRLLTLTGPGGTGKTRLALQAGAEVTDQFDLVAFVDLARVVDPDRIAATIAESIGVDVAAGADPLDVIAASLAQRSTLLVVDNFEHLIAGAPVLRAVLEASPRARAIVTSRELLRLTGEQHYPVPPMHLADDEAESPEELASVEAVQLFVARARAILPDFRLTTDNASDVLAVCRRLDGLPLAIELAAARVRLFPPSELLRRLDVDLAGLGTGPVDAPVRQRTLRDLIGWSYDLLSADEQRLFDRLGVFVGGRTLDAVEAVCAEGLDLDPLTAIEALVDKSLLRTTIGRAGDVRFTMLATIREVAHLHLRDTGELADVRTRHARFFADLAEEADPELRRTGVHWYDRLEDEVPNLNAALDWCFDGGDIADGFRLVGALRDFWFYRSRYQDLADWVAIAMRDTIDDPRLRAGVLGAAGFLRYGRQEPEAASLLEEASVLYRSVGDARREALMTVWAGGAMQLTNAPWDATRARLLEGIELAESLGADEILSQGLNMLGELDRETGRFADALDLQLRSLELARSTGELQRVAMVTHNIAYIHHHLGNQDQVADWLMESLDLCFEIGFEVQLAYCLFGLAQEAALRGHHDAGARLLGCAQGEFARRHVIPQPADAPDQEQAADSVRKSMDADAFRSAEARGTAMTLDEAVKLAHEIFDHGPADTNVG